MAPTASPTPCISASIGPSAAGGSVIKVTALNFAFVAKELTAPAAKPFSIDFDNQDAGAQHNIVIRDGCGTRVFYGDVLDGPKKATYHVPALPAGSYPFFCAIHPSEMTGVLTVK